jgi:formate dehydrogenase (coenzyme F420) beta subunit
MKELRELAKRLLEDGSVRVVIGYERGPRGVRPAFVRRPEDAERLVFNEHCVQNLSVYLSPRRRQVSGLGRAAVVVKACDARAVAGLIRESQLKRDDVVLLGVRCGGVTRQPEGDDALCRENVAPRCETCTGREPGLADHVVGPLPPPPPANGERTARIEALDAMTAAERWSFWKAELGRCLRCNACRETCPLCFCERCVQDKSEPQWIETSPHARGNYAWHMTRALHLAGRCVDCSECERACPVEIPLSLLNRKVAMVVEQRFAYRTVDDPGVPAPIGTFRQDDAEEFIR